MKMMKFANHLTKDRNAHPSSGVGIKAPDAGSYTGLPGGTDCLSRRGYLPGWLGKSPNVAIHWNVYRSGLRHRRLEGG
jgi:hypothetical protein